MDAGPARDILTLGLGVATGMLSALFGVGGAVVSTPGIRVLGASALLSVGTTLPSILPSAVSGTARYVREELVAWPVVAWTVPAGIVASVGGSLLSRAVPGNGHLLMVLTAALLGITAWRMGRPELPTSPGSPGDVAGPTVDGIDADAASGDVRRSPPWLSGIGAVAGGLSGLLGIGGGVVMVPAFTEVARLPLKTAIASSLVCVGIFAVPGTITHAIRGDVDWRFAIALAVGVIPGARLGAAVAIRATDVRLRRAVALFLGVIAIVYGAGELLALR